MRTINGEVGFQAVEAEKVTVNGSVTGAEIGPGGDLIVNGMFQGDATVEEGGTLCVQGMFVPGQIYNRGMVTVAGMVVAGPRDFDRLGRFAVAIGSMVDGNHILEADGTLRELRPGTHKMNQHLGAGPDDYCAWMAQLRRFVPTVELKGWNAED